MNLLGGDAVAACAFAVHCFALGPPAPPPKSPKSPLRQLAKTDDNAVLG